MSVGARIPESHAAVLCTGGQHLFHGQIALGSFATDGGVMFLAEQVRPTASRTLPTRAVSKAAVSKAAVSKAAVSKAAVFKAAIFTAAMKETSAPIDPRAVRDAVTPRADRSVCGPCSSGAGAATEGGLA
jgi:hypothetical protein